MKVKDLKEYLNLLPLEVDNYDIIFSEVGIIDNTSEINLEDKGWYRKDINISQIAIDSATEELILAKKATIDLMYKLTGEQPDDINKL